VSSLLRRTLFSVDPATVAADTEGYSTLGLIGIDLGTDGRLTIDQDDLDEKLNGNLDAFSDFFRGLDDELTLDVNESGVFVRLEEGLRGLVDRSTAPDGTVLDGLFGSRKKSIGDQIRGFDDEIERLQFRLDKLEESLVAKFASLERLLGGLQSQQAYLGSLPTFER
jgi:flagellar capping protein FliD